MEWREFLTDINCFLTAVLQTKAHCAHCSPVIALRDEAMMVH